MKFENDLDKLLFIRGWIDVTEEIRSKITFVKGAGEGRILWLKWKGDDDTDRHSDA